MVSALAFAAASALAQTPQQREICYRTSAADDQTIGGCTAVIQGGKESQDNLAIAYYNRGIGYQNSKDYELALKDYDQALRLRPAYSSAFNNRGNVFQSLRQYERAIQDYDQATRIAPNDPLPSAATPGAGSARPTRPSPISTKRSGSSPTTPMPTKTAVSSTTT
jgi:tetratricopeptide (TPR) repeat protein